MVFWKRNAGLFTGVLCILALIGVIWFCLGGASSDSAPEGTFVERIFPDSEVTA